jgi:hypothetical protein
MPTRAQYLRRQFSVFQTLASPMIILYQLELNGVRAHCNNRGWLITRYRIKHLYTLPCGSGFGQIRTFSVGS